MIAMTVASVLMMGLTAGYSALSRVAARLADAQSQMTGGSLPPVCRTNQTSLPPAGRSQPVRCELPEVCIYDVVSQTCRTTA